MSTKKVTLFQKLVYAAAKKIPRGKVSTYQDIARVIGKPKSARAVGNALNRNPFAPAVPCHRVVRNTGKIGGFAGGCKNKVKLLEKEGVLAKDGKIVDFENKRVILSGLTRLRTSDVLWSLRQLDIGCPKRQTRKS
ncbi:MAG: hypothetical protein A2288_01110 [Candidatus Moranbacteria bacterium RIFOXYA12_FULL_44_15]|nr:MAG: hypothetical protein A2288_01110 [Candidatus Moranbacteria bacterium RIFOXYA12_FULL_44_15]OGI34777.1 MAG: hypothetical protein A2259_00580 [Candidatus Moranbacteria bacterium RIFOXYA2_FULL_43_15]